MGARAEQAHTGNTRNICTARTSTRGKYVSGKQGRGEGGRVGEGRKQEKGEGKGGVEVKGTQVHKRSTSTQCREHNSSERKARAHKESEHDST